ncbi:MULTISPECIES: SDR family NAD(P)-dependent oxidoreductase [Actinomadura]|uniref:3-oxoacyl-[acyl-carrier protein] reductase n=1 Tax=Actinomadura madurae TaxID=1993 RepID=A0A1I5IBQ8_9ACTN|nr:SDR family oxidoreductase [Actinomadura madurae]SFO57943.1 3-oxoacyl-[acyl-carrier protein] reductase [Actinomadura madurae]SPT57342.1 3-oxoacyl-[acyl-carrier-protein] reductase FabG [Actinomadura madurae]
MRMSSVRFDYTGERVLVTGAAGLIGRALVRRFAGAGARVLAVDVDDDGLKVFDGDPRVATMVGDLAREDVADAVFARLLRDGGLDVLVNNAAMTEVRTPFIDFSAGLWDAVVAANLRSAYLLSVRAVRHWRDAGRGGAIVSLSSPGGSRAHEDQSAYDVTKAGIEALSRAIAVELGGLGIRANCVAPASVVGEIRPATDIPAGRTTAPEEVADAALFLASPAAEQLNGHVLRVDGGLHARLRTDPAQEQQRAPA